MSLVARIILQNLLARKRAEAAEEGAVMARKPISVMLSNEDLIDAARYYGEVAADQAFLGLTHVDGPDGKPAVVVMFESANIEENAAAAEGEDASADDGGITADDAGVLALLHNEDSPRGFAARLLAFLTDEVTNEPPFMTVLDVWEHRHVIFDGDERIYTGEVSVGFRLYGDPDRYEEKHPGAPPPPPPYYLANGGGDKG